MRLRTKYILFIVLLHAVTLALSYYIFRNNKLLFIVSEIVIIISVVLAWQLYIQLLQPLNTLMTGIDALKSRDFNVKFRPTGKIEMDQLIDVYNQMVDQLRLERTHQEQQHFFLEKLIATSPTGIIVLDYDNKIEQINPKAVQILGGEEKDIKGHYIRELSHPILQQIGQLSTGESKTISVTGVDTYKLQMAHFIDRGFPRNFITIEELTAEILTAEKKVYGKVIRMMAHEVNNTIGPVNSILNTALKTRALWEYKDSGNLQNALQIAIERNNNLNDFMRGFADLVKLPEPSRTMIDLHQLLAHVLTLMQHAIREKEIALVFQKDQQSFPISADEQQMEQAFINVIKNAIEAIDQKGTITIQANALNRTLIISDTGKGIAPQDSDQLFSPFYSTKKNGQGIGLTLVREILLNHHFTFSLKTVAPNQTEFFIQF